MAKVVYNAAVDELVGSLAGSVFQRNSSGTIVRTKSYTRKRSTTSQNSRRLIFSAAATKWQTLSAANQASWVTFAASFTFIDRYGKTRIMHGRSLYIACYCSSTLLPTVVADLAPTYHASTPVSGITLTYTSAIFSIDITGSALAYGNYAYIFATPLLKSLSFANRKAFRFIGSWNNTLGWPANITTKYKTAMGYTSLPMPSIGTMYIQVYIITVYNGVWVPSLAVYASKSV
jgi:hypothetical protein